MTDETKKTDKSEATTDNTKEASNGKAAAVKKNAEKAMGPEISGLEAIYEHKIFPRENSLRVGTKVRLVVFAIVICYCSFLYYLVCGFTSDEAFSMLRGQVDVQLPAVQKDTVESMKKNAPAVINDCSKQMIASIPDLRKQLQTEATRVTGEQIISLQQGLNQVFDDLVKTSKVELDKMDSKLTTAQKMDLLKKQMQLKMFEQSREVVDGIAKEYSSKMKVLNVELKALQTKKNLTPKEKHQREILRVWSKLMSKQLKDVNKAFAEGVKELSKEDQPLVTE